MKVIVATGLVPVKALSRFRQHPEGSVFGLDPPAAMASVSNGEVELFPIPEGTETFDYGGDPIPPKKKSAVKERPAGRPAGDGPIEIPDDWGTRHHLQRVALAKRISGNDQVATVEAAEQIIREEIEKRKASAGSEQQQPEQPPQA